MATTFLATADVDTFTNPSHSVRISASSANFGPSIFNNTAAVPSSVSDSREPYNGFIEGPVSDDTAGPEDTMLDIMAFVGIGSSVKTFYFEVFANNTVDYSQSSSVFIDLELPVQLPFNGFASNDVLTDMAGVTGSAFSDVIRGSNVSDFPPDSTIIIVNGTAIEPRHIFSRSKIPGKTSFPAAPAMTCSKAAAASTSSMAGLVSISPATIRPRRASPSGFPVSAAIPRAASQQAATRPATC